jgi:hypothetical protein
MRRFTPVAIPIAALGASPKFHLDVLNGRIAPIRDVRDKVPQRPPHVWNERTRFRGRGADFEVRVESR